MLSTSLISSQTTDVLGTSVISSEATDVLGPSVISSQPTDVLGTYVLQTLQQHMMEAVLPDVAQDTVAHKWLDVSDAVVSDFVIQCAAFLVFFQN